MSNSEVVLQLNATELQQAATQQRLGREIILPYHTALGIEALLKDIHELDDNDSALRDTMIEASISLIDVIKMQLKQVGEQHHKLTEG